MSRGRRLFFEMPMDFLSPDWERIGTGRCRDARLLFPRRCPNCEDGACCCVDMAAVALAVVGLEWHSIPKTTLLSHAMRDEYASPISKVAVVLVLVGLVWMVGFVVEFDFFRRTGFVVIATRSFERLTL